VKHNKFEQQFLNECRKKLGLNTEDPILLAVSGGVDSMVMLYLFHRLHFNISVAHCNFGLRGDASNEDEKACKQICDELQIPFFHQNFETEKFANTEKVSIQMAARTLRYAWFEELMEQHHFFYLATAHHSNDQSETILLNLISGKGAGTLQGIPLKNKKIIRPLLSFSKNEILSYAQEKKIVWREDESNLTTDYQRNFIRHKVLPLLEELNPSIQENLVRLGKRMSDMNLLTEEYAKSILAPCVHHHHDHITISFSTLRSHPANNYLFWLALKEFGFEGIIIEDIIAASKDSGKTFYSADYQLQIDRDTYIIKKVDTEFTYEICIESSTQKINLPGGSLNFQSSNPTQLAAPAYEENAAYIDASLIQFPIRIRTWKSGDSFFPLGMNQKKKLSDYFIDNKTPLHQKNKKLLLVNGDEIVWILGDRLDHRYRITPTTTSILKMKWEAYES
jgi:tRNA(Ile)-lysidine synthase